MSKRSDGNSSLGENPPHVRTARETSVYRAAKELKKKTVVKIWRKFIFSWHFCKFKMSKILWRSWKFDLEKIGWWSLSMKPPSLMGQEKRFLHSTMCFQACGQTFKFALPESSYSSTHTVRGGHWRSRDLPISKPTHSIPSVVYEHHALHLFNLATPIDPRGLGWWHLSFPYYFEQGTSAKWVAGEKRCRVVPTLGRWGHIGE